MKYTEIIKKKENMDKLKILKIIHGYPPYYMAGSEIYSYNLCNELKKRSEIDISVFTRVEDIYNPLYQVEESIESGIKIIRVNKSKKDYTFRDKYIDKKLVRIFEIYLQKINPDVIHIGHLSHLTVLIVDIIKKYNIPIIFTLHDYWMICIKGQLINKDFQLCSGPDLEKCVFCNQKYFIDRQTGEREVRRWLNKIKEINQKIDLFIAPSRFLKKVYVNNGIPADKILYMDYGFNKEYFKKLKKTKDKRIRFGFTGRIIPVKGIDLLIKCFNEIDPKKASLNIYGRLDDGINYLKKKVKNLGIHFHGGYNYWDIGKVLSNIDVLIVPSIWYENSPLVIHEASLAKIPVIASNLGGMAELIIDGRNGFLFEPRNVDDLRDKIYRFINQPELIETISQDSSYIRSIQEDAGDLIKIYKKLVKKEVLSQIAI